MAAIENPSSKQNRCVFFEVFKNFINTVDENFDDEQKQSPQFQMMLQQNIFEQQQAASLPISPFLIHQLLRNEGFATKILIFSSGSNQQQQQHNQGNNLNNNNHNQYQQQQQQVQFQNEDGSFTVAKDVYVRCLVQFETEEEAKKVVARYGASKQGCVVFLQNIPCLMLRLRAKPSRDGQVFVTENNETSLVVTQDFFHFLGPDFPRTSNDVNERNILSMQEQQQQQQQQQQQFQMQTFQQQAQTQVESNCDANSSNQKEKATVELEEPAEATTATRTKRKYQAPPPIRQREE